MMRLGTKIKREITQAFEDAIKSHLAKAGSKKVASARAISPDWIGWKTMSTTYQQVLLDVQKLNFSEQLKLLKNLAALAEKNYHVRKKAQFGSAKGLIDMSDDFDVFLDTEKK